MKLFQIIKKNFLVLLRSKTSAVIILLGPLIVMFLVGLAFSNASTYNIKLGYYSSSYSELTDSFVQKLSQKYKTHQYYSIDECIDAVELGRIHSCIQFPSNMQIDNKGADNEIVFYADYSRINLVESVINTVSGLIAERSGEVSRELALILINKLKETKTEVQKDKILVIGLKEKDSTMTKSTENAKTEILAMDLSINMEAFKLALIDLQINATKEQIKIAREKIDDAKNAVTSLNASSSQKEALIAILVAAQESLDKVDAGISNGSNATSLSALIENVKMNLNVVKQRFEFDTIKRDNAYARLLEIKQGLVATLRDLDTLEVSLKGIEDSISSVKVMDAEQIVSPVKTKIEPITHQTKLNYIVPTLLVVVVMFISILLATTLVIMEKNSAANFRNTITPTGDFIFFLSALLTSIIIVMIQVIIMLLINTYVFHAYIPLMQLGNLSVAMLVIILTFVLIGILIGYVFRSEETGTLAVVAVGSVFLFVSSTILPLESIPEYMMKIAQYNPYVISDFLVKKVYLFQTPLALVANDIYTLLIYSGVLIIIALVVQKMIKAEFAKKTGAKMFLFFRRSRKKKEEMKKTLVKEHGSEAEDKEKKKKPDSLKEEKQPEKKKSLDDLRGKEKKK